MTVVIWAHSTFFSQIIH